MGERLYDGAYRLIYNVLAAFTLLPVLAAGALVLPHRILWEVSRPFSFLLMGIQLIGIVGLGASLLQTDVMRFIGVGQLLRYFQGASDVNPQPVLTTTGTYRLVRHPLYFFGLLLLWFSPIMTLSLFLFNVAATIYFWVGSGYEEKRLQATFGEKYDEYRQQVPRLLPIKIRL
jgi:protein-S-isoprenylcysteine O-methyltransferase Ste14